MLGPQEWVRDMDVEIILKSGTIIPARVEAGDRLEERDDWLIFGKTLLVHSDEIAALNLLEVDGE